MSEKMVSPRLILKVIKATPAAFEHLPAEMRDDQEFLLPLGFGSQELEIVPASEVIYITEIRKSQNPCLKYATA